MLKLDPIIYVSVVANDGLDQNNQLSRLSAAFLSNYPRQLFVIGLQPCVKPVQVTVLAVETQCHVKVFGQPVKNGLPYGTACPSVCSSVTEVLWLNGER